MIERNLNDISDHHLAQENRPDFSSAVQQREKVIIPAPAKDCWDKVEIIIKAISSIVLPVVIGISSCTISSSIKDKELGQKYVGIAVDILNSDPVEQKMPLREWAIGLVNDFSDRKLSKEGSEILRTGTLSRSTVVALQGVGGRGELGSIGVGATHNATVKALANEFTQVFGGKIVIYLRSIKFYDGKNEAIEASIVEPGGDTMKIASLKTGECITFAGYSITLRSILPDSAEFFISDEKGCQ